MVDIVKALLTEKPAYIYKYIHKRPYVCVYICIYCIYIYTGKTITVGSLD